MISSRMILPYRIELFWLTCSLSFCGKYASMLHTHDVDLNYQSAEYRPLNTKKDLQPPPFRLRSQMPLKRR